MRIGIDARLYKKGLGLGRYVEKLVEHLQTIQTKDEFFLFLHKDAYQSLQLSSPQFHKVLADVGWYTFKEQLVMPFLFLKYGCDIVHIPHFNIPLLYPKKMIMTIHDLILLKHPQSATSAASTRHPLVHWLKYRAYRFLLLCAVHRVNHIVAVSYGVQKDLHHYFSLSLKKISVIYEGVQKNELPLDHDFTGTQELSKFIKKPYALYVGNSYPHKNVEGLLDVFEDLKNEKTLPLSLILCGQEDFFTKRIRNEIQKRKLEERVVHLGTVSDDVLAYLYAHAVAFITLSLEEGFGLPPLEAQGRGTPVIVPHSSVFPEILGNSALYCDPNNIEECKKALTDISENKKLRTCLIQRGCERIKKFQWETMAHSCMALYKKI